jgi:hypothetical protein
MARRRPCLVIGTAFIDKLISIKMLLQMAAQTANDYLSSPSVLADQVTAAGLSAWLIQRLKASRQIPFINEHSDWINRVLSLGFALATTLGMHFAWHSDVSHGGGVLLIGLPPMSEFLSGVWRTAGSFVMQQVAYRGFIKHEPGLQAVDVVAEVVAGHKEELAAVVENQDNSVLKLKEPISPVMPFRPDVPIDWEWGKEP